MEKEKDYTYIDQARSKNYTIYRGLLLLFATALA